MCAVEECKWSGSREITLARSPEVNPYMLDKAKAVERHAINIYNKFWRLVKKKNKPSVRRLQYLITALESEVKFG